MSDLIVENCIKIKQNDMNLYVFVLTSEQIHNNFVVSRRYEDREEGYQRILRKSKVKNIEKYLKDVENNYPSILPNSILIALDNIEYIEEEKKLIIRNGINEDYKGLIIDGQHRSKGAYEYSSDFPLIIIGVSDLEPKYQARLFITINDTQTSLPKSLYKDLFILIDDKEFTKDMLDNESIDVDVKAVEMARELTENKDYSLYKMIDMTGEKQIGHISLMEFVRNIIPYINYDNGKFKEFTFMEQVKIVDNYFTAIKESFPEEWNKDKKPLFKTTIFGGLLKSLDDVWDIVILDSGNFKTENIKKVFELSKREKSENECIRSLESLANNLGGGFKAQENYRKKLIKIIKNNIKEYRSPKVEL